MANAAGVSATGVSVLPYNESGKAKRKSYARQLAVYCQPLS